MLNLRDFTILPVTSKAVMREQPLVYDLRLLQGE